MTSIVLVEDHGIVREGLRKVLEECAAFTVTAEAANGISAVEAVEAHQAHIREKIGVRSKAELIEYAHRRGLLNRTD